MHNYITSILPNTFNTNQYPQISNSILLVSMFSLLNPLQLVKSRLQTMSELVHHGKLTTAYKGIMDCFRSVKNNQGIKTFWKGNAIGVTRFYPNEYINITVKCYINSLFNESLVSNMVSGAMGGLTAATILYPIDTLRLMLATQLNKHKLLSLIHQRVKAYGIQSFYRGLSSAIISVGFYRGCLYGTYDTLKAKSTTPTHKWLSAYFSAIVASSTLYPFDTIRRRKIITNSKQNSLELLWKIVRREGIRSVFSGSTINCIQCLAASATLILLDNQRVRQ